MKKNFYLGLIVFALSVFCVTVSQAAAPFIRSTFNKNAEGWTGEPNKVSVIYYKKGGNSGGFIGVQGFPQQGAGTAVAFPGPEFLTNLLRFDGGTLSYDIKVIQQPNWQPINTETWPNWGGFKINMNAPGHSLTFTYPLAGLPNPPLLTDRHWTTYTVPMKARYWRISDQDFATQADFERIISNVTYMDINLVIGGSGIVGLDNFKITEAGKPIANPEPASMFLFSVGGFVMAWLKKKLK
jgi:hypothetical protein